ncbi:MAG TPA: hypothetical protein VHE35_12015, partial [Kofleriaceae bacterium]|nr:hypothetical protein [Kofleriaceae bacterium]
GDVAAAWPAAGPALLVAAGRWHDGDAAWGPRAPLAWRSVAGGLLVEERDVAPIDLRYAGAVTARTPTDDERRTLALAARVARHVRAHALVIAAHGSTVAVVGGQPDLRRALLVARGCENDVLHDSVAAMSARIDDPLEVDALADSGVRAVVQPGVSTRDQEVVAAADRRGLIMILTGLERLRR